LDLNSDHQLLIIYLKLVELLNHFNLHINLQHINYLYKKKSNSRPVLIWHINLDQLIFLIVAKTMIRRIIRSLGSISFSHSPFAFLCIEREGREQKPEEVNKVEQLSYCIGNVSGSFALKSLPLSLSFLYKLYLSLIDRDYMRIFFDTTPLLGWDSSVRPLTSLWSIIFLTK
jgi:hypothetical protein